MKRFDQEYSVNIGCLKSLNIRNSFLNRYSSILNKKKENKKKKKKKL